MLLKFARQKVGEAMAGAGTPITAGRNLDRVTVKKLAMVVGAGLVAVTVTSNLDTHVRGAWPVICAGATVLAVTGYLLRHDKRLLWAVVGTWPVVAIVAFALTDTPATVGHANQAATFANTQTMLGVGQLADLGPKITDWGLHTALPWCWDTARDGLAKLVSAVRS